MTDSQWKILVVDDDVDVIKLTQITLSKFTLNGKSLQIFEASSREKAELIIQEHPDTAMVLLDVVMEEVDGGLRFVNYVRWTKRNPYWNL